MDNSSNNTDLKNFNLTAKIKNYYDSHQSFFSSSFFVLGFLFDVFTLGRIDDFLNLLSISFFLLLAIAWFVFNAIDIPQDRDGNKSKLLLFKTRSVVFHFFIGCLLSMFSIFLFKSASFFSMLSVVAFVFILLLANEISRVQNQKMKIKSFFLQICIIGYSLFLIPQLFGRVGLDVFCLSLFFSLFVSFLINYLILKLDRNSIKLVRGISVVQLLVTTCVLLFYVFKVLPPLPLSIQEIGIYHDVQKRHGNYLLFHEHHKLKFWLKGDQIYNAQDGERIYVFMRLFAPKGFSDKVFIHWQFYKNHKWQTSDRVKININGGRGLGFRGFSYKNNYFTGPWRVLVETQDKLEIGRVSFDILLSESSEKKIFNIKKR